MAFKIILAVAACHYLLIIASAQATDLSLTPDLQPLRIDRKCPLPACQSCPSVNELRAPRIGFALETGYGTAAVRLHDGSVHDVALVAGDASYTTLLRQLATGPIDRTPHRFDTIWEEVQYARAQAQRRSNKLIGRPATPQTAILASMVSKLLDATRTWLGDDHTVTAAVLSSLDRVRLTSEEIGDIFDYLKLKNLMMGPTSIWELEATYAAYAGYGQGLCHTYTDEYKCEREEARLPYRRILHIDFSLHSLSGTLEGVRSVDSGGIGEGFVSHDLGLKHEHVYPISASRGLVPSDLYWNAICDRIREFVKSLTDHRYLPDPIELILTGQAAINKTFQAAVKTALHDLVADKTILAFTGDHHETTDEEQWQSLFSFATARGAAEIAKRRQEGPFRCDQSAECRRRREKVHGERHLPRPDQQTVL